jgi:transposase
MIERFGKLPDDVDQLKALALAATARAERFEADASANKTEAETLQSETLSLKTKVADLMQTTAVAKAEIARLTSILKTLLRGRFGKHSEKLGADESEQQSFVFEEVETGLAAVETRLAAKANARPRASQGKPRFPAHLERVEEIVEPEIRPEFEGKERVRIGQDESVRLDVVRRGQLPQSRQAARRGTSAAIV